MGPGRSYECSTGVDEEMIAEVLANPCYAGIGPYPAIVDDDTWARCTARRIQEEGPEEAIVFTLQVFESAFPVDDVLCC